MCWSGGIEFSSLSDIHPLGHITLCRLRYSCRLSDFSAQYSRICTACTRISTPSACRCLQGSSGKQPGRPVGSACHYKGNTMTSACRAESGAAELSVVGCDGPNADKSCFRIGLPQAHLLYTKNMLLSRPHVAIASHHPAKRHLFSSESAAITCWFQRMGSMYICRKDLFSRAETIY
jgi:hypothetical protein